MGLEIMSYDDDIQRAHEVTADALSTLTDLALNQSGLIEDLFNMIDTLKEFIGPIYPDHERWDEWSDIRGDLQALEENYANA